MKIKTKILFYFSSAIIMLSACSMGLVYYFFAEHREETFQQQQYDKIKQTIELLSEFKQMSVQLSSVIDKQWIHDFYDEKLLIFDRNKKLIFSSLDDLSIKQANEILYQLSPSKVWIETKDGNYDLIAVYIEHKNESYYAISKAYDTFGYSKKTFLKQILTAMFFVTTLTVILLSIYFANIITLPIIELSNKINLYNPNKKNKPIQLFSSTKELKILEQRFNELLQRTSEALSYQKHIVHHISHELKTPLAIIVSELEKIKYTDNISTIKQLVEYQIIRAKSLGTILNTLLEIAKLEAQPPKNYQQIRIDELIFDIFDELKLIYPKFIFELKYSSANFYEQKLTINANKNLMFHAFQNLLINCVNYSDNEKAIIEIDCLQEDFLKIQIINSGTIISKEEETQLFTRFFRGKNNRKEAGFGLGLVLTKKIIELHNGTISYNSKPQLNIFEIKLKN